MRGFVLERRAEDRRARQADVQRARRRRRRLPRMGARTCCCSWADSTAFPASPRRSTAGGRWPEIMASFWIPVMASRGPRPDVRRGQLVLAVPYIFVDNPMSCTSWPSPRGLRLREDDGAPSRRRRSTRALTMEAFGGNFRRDEGAAGARFWRSRRSGLHGWRARSRVLDGPAGLVSRLAGELPGRNAGGEIVLPDIRFTADLVDNMLDGEVHQLFLKQFRDARDKHARGLPVGGRGAVQGPAGVEQAGRARRRRRPPARQPPDRPGDGRDEPARADRVRRGLDMVVEHGVEVAPLTSALPSSGPGSLVGVDGYATSVAARHAWREVTGLEQGDPGSVPAGLVDFRSRAGSVAGWGRGRVEQYFDP